MGKRQESTRKKFALCLLSFESERMLSKKMFRESELAALAKRWRLKSGKTKIEVANDLGVARATIQLGEENPEQSLSKLRIRIIEKYSPYKVVGPVYLLQKK